MAWQLQMETPVADSLDAASLDQLFRTARSRNGWREETLPESTWVELYDLLKMGPTSANVSPARFVFVTSQEGKAKLAPFLSETNRVKSIKAPAIVIIGHDLKFADAIPKLFPHNPGAAAWFADPVMAQTTAFRNGSLQGAYLILAARALGLDAGPMSGFDNAGVDEAFFAGSDIKSNFICALGHGVDEPWPRLPRLPFDEACKIV
jgi:3-hydroxypropanoate dehydrogenase